MNTNIQSFDLTPFYIQAGYGVPSHISTIGTEYTDLNTAIKYINKNGINSWAIFVDNNNPTFTGTTDFLPKFTSSSTIGNSTIWQAPNSSQTFINYLGRPGLFGTTYLSVQRGQSQIDISLGNPDALQESEIRCDNSTGLIISSKGYLSFKSGSAYTDTLTLTSGNTVFINNELSANTITTSGYTQNNGYIIFNNLMDAANDAAAALLGIPLNGLYRNGNIIQIRIT